MYVTSLSIVNENNNYSLNTFMQFFPLSKHVLVSNRSVVASYQNYSKINLVNQKKFNIVSRNDCK